MLANQMAAPNSPQWFNSGLHWAYGIEGPAQGHFYCEPETGEVARSQNAYERPQPHACFIQSIKDDLVNEGGIMDLWVNEARIFKFGSGTGTNFSSLRGADEPLSGGGKSSGLMSFLKIGDRAAGAIKSGGTTRRAAKMVILDCDHPDIEEFVGWKVREEQKVAALVSGSRMCKQHMNAIIAACNPKDQAELNGGLCQPEKNREEEGEDYAAPPTLLLAHANRLPELLDGFYRLVSAVESRSQRAPAGAFRGLEFRRPSGEAYRLERIAERDVLYCGEQPGESAMSVHVPGVQRDGDRIALDGPPVAAQPRERESEIAVRGG